MDLPRLTRAILRTTSRTVATLGCVVIIGALTGCGGGSSGSSGNSSDNSSANAAQKLTFTLSPTSSTENPVTTPGRDIGLTVTQTLNLNASSLDGSQIHWTVSPATGNGRFSSTITASGTTTTFTAPSTAGVYTITASSGSEQATVQVGVTDLTGVFTYHNDNSRDGVNAREYALTPANVNTKTFGKLFSCKVDGAIYAQPLWVSNLTINGVKRNAVVVATEHDSLFAFDADVTPCQTLWSASLIDQAHGGNSGETTIPSGATNYLTTGGDTFIAPEVGITGTPVIDPTTNTVYVVSQSVQTDASGNHTFYSRLHALNLDSGTEQSGSPVVIVGTITASGYGTNGANDDWFDPKMHLQRAGLALVNGTVYVAWASYADIAPYYGWVMGYQSKNDVITQTALFNAAPSSGFAGIWMGGAAPAADSSGNLYLITGNGMFDATSTTTPNNDYGDSLLKIAVNQNSASADKALSVAQYFTPSDWMTDYVNDKDFGSGGAAVLADIQAAGSSTPLHLIVGGGKDGNLYVLNRDALGGVGDTAAWQEIQTGYGIFSTAAFWNQTIYLVPFRGAPTSYTVSTQNPPQFVEKAVASSSTGAFGFPGATPSISANGTTSGILWALDNTQACVGAAKTCGPAILHAFDAGTLAELWNSSQASDGSDSLGYAVKFTVPTVANGKVYVGTRGNDTGSGTPSNPGELDVYGEK